MYHFDKIVVAKGPESDVSPSLSKSQLHQSHQSSQYWSPEINFMFMVQYYSHCNKYKYIISIRSQNIFSLQSKHLKIRYILRPMLSLVVLTFVGVSVSNRNRFWHLLNNNRIVEMLTTHIWMTVLHFPALLSLVSPLSRCFCAMATI